MGSYELARGSNVPRGGRSATTAWGNTRCRAKGPWDLAVTVTEQVPVTVPGHLFLQCRGEFAVKVVIGGVYVCQRLSLLVSMQGSGGKPSPPTGLVKCDCPG